MARVYVSSTIADLKRERRAVMDWLVAAQHQVVHSYRPDGETVRASCLEDVDTCDVYVLIAGYRYGFQPADGNPDGLSITHLEFRRAGESGKPRVALVRTSIPDVSLSDMEDPRRAVLVIAFRGEVSREVRPALFHDESGLIGGLSTGLQGVLEKLGKRSGGVWPAGRRAVGPVLRLAPRPPFLAGREELLADLGSRLAGDGDSGPRVVVLSGLAGAGKTSVAVEYAHRHLAESGVVWQLPAEDAAVLAAGFSELAAQLGAGDVRGRDPVAAVHSALAGSPTRWLLIFDNARDRESVAGLVPPAGLGQVLITSRNALWPPGQLAEVSVLDETVAADFLIARTGDRDGHAAASLAEAVGGLPLALEQAAAYMQATGDSLASYLASFRQRRADLLARGEPVGYPGTVATTWQLAFTQLGETAPTATGLLRLIAFFAPDAIPLGMLLQLRPGLAGRLRAEVTSVLVTLLEDELAAKDAVVMLRRYSLVRPAGDAAVSVHRLIQAVTVDQMPEPLARSWRGAAASVIEAAIPQATREPKAWPACAVLLPHVRAALDLTSDGMARIATYLGYSGSYQAARDLFQLIADALADDAACDPENQAALTARGRLAYWTAQAGDAAAATDQVRALLLIMERVLGHEDPETLRVRANLASYIGQAGDPAGARNQLAALLPVQEPVLGPEHPDTLATRASLATWTGRAGDPAGARDQFATLLPLRERILGPEHPETLTARANLARWTGAAGEPARARDDLAALLPARERILGREHPETLKNRRMLANWTGHAGDAAKARDQLAALLPVQERVHGPEHPDTLITRRNLAISTGHAGDAAGARDQLAALLPTDERVLGTERPETLDVRAGLAGWTGQAGDAADARDQLASLLPICERIRGSEHPATQSVRSDLTYWTQQAQTKSPTADGDLGMAPLDTE